jgi:hypothetical protein
MLATVMRHGGSLLVKYINSLQTHMVFLAPMCQEVLQDNELKKNFLAKAPNGHSDMFRNYVVRVSEKSIIFAILRGGNLVL